MLMLLALHIFIALTSVAWATVTFFKPAQSKFLLSYGLIAGTLISGTVLVFAADVSILRVCMSGLVYTSLVSVVTVAAHRKFATEKIPTKE